MDDRPRKEVKFSSSHLILKFGAVAAVVASGVATAALMITVQMSAHNRVACGAVATRDALAATAVIQGRMGYFPPGASNIEYWCRPFGTWINGSYDINESSLRSWAKDRGWQLKRLTPQADLHLSIRLIRPNGFDGYFHWDHQRECYFCRIGEYQLVYDKDAGRAYFSDTGLKAEPPRNN